MLQCGRDVAAAENPIISSSTRPAASSFNVAATLQPRKTSNRGETDTNCTELQSGRDLAAAENLLLDGKSLDGHLWLQCGRDVAAAENPHGPVTISAVTRRFNVAATLP